MERDFKGVWIPKEVWLDERLSALDKIILVEIDSLDNEDTHCYASNEYLAEFCQCSERKITEAISKLLKYGYIKVAKFDGKKRFLSSSLAKNASLPSKKCQADSQNLLHNNIYNNKENNIRKKERKFDDVFEEKNVSSKLKEAFIELIKSRKLNKKNMTDKALELAIDKVRKLGKDEEEQIKIIYQSIENGWQGLFPLKEENRIENNQKELYKIKTNEDIAWKKLFVIWEKLLGYKLAETVDNVEAAKELLKIENEDKIKLLIASLKMRSQYKYLQKEIKNIQDFRSLLDNRDYVWNFYNEHFVDWQKWSAQASEGKKRWML